MARFLLRYKLKAISLAAGEAELATGDILLLSGLRLCFLGTGNSSCRGNLSNIGETNWSVQPYIARAWQPAHDRAVTMHLAPPCCHPAYPTA